jgi:hypothetical protein
MPVQGSAALWAEAVDRQQPARDGGVATATLDGAVDLPSTAAVGDVDLRRRSR